MSKCQNGNIVKDIPITKVVGKSAILPPFYSDKNWQATL